MADLAGVQLTLVDSVDKAVQFMTWLSQRRPDDIVAVDTETGEYPGHPTGDALSPWHGRLRLVQVGDGMAAWAIPWDGWNGVFIEAMKRYQGEIICHNVAFEARFFALHSEFQIPWHRTHDTMIAAHLINPLESAALKTLTSKYVDARSAGLQRVLDEGMSKNGWTWGSVPVHYQPYWSYGALDCVLTTRLWELQKEKVGKGGPYALAYDLEMATRRVCTEMELNGARVDVDYAKKKYEQLHEYAESIKSWGSKCYGGRSMTSNRDLIDIFENTLSAEITELTPSGQKKMDKEQLKKFTVNYNGEIGQLAQTVLDMRKAAKLAETYFLNFINQNIDGLLHPNVRTLGARTSRMCLAEGTMIDGPRDLVKHPAGVPIEQMKPGDLVYSFDESGTPHVKPVTHVHDKGTKRVLRLVYAAEGNGSGRRLMEIRATPDHRFALRTGEYKELSDLHPGDRLGYLSRTVLTGSEDRHQYAMSKISWNGERMRSEARYVYQDTGGNHSMRLVHHLDENSLNQHPLNLSGLAGRAEHMSVHRGPGDCPYTKDELTEIVHSSTNLKHVASSLGVGYHSLRLWMRELGVAMPHNLTGPYGNKYAVCPMTATEFFMRLEESSEGRRGGVEQLARELQVPGSVVRRWKKEFSRENHVVIAVIDDNESLPVYDLTIEDTPNFVANELWVHNSITDPALQTLGKGERTVRDAFIARDEDEVLITSDLDQVEFRMFASMSQDPQLIALFQRADRDMAAGDPNADAFTYIMRELYNDPTATKKDKRRKLIKGYIYGRLYGAGVAKQALTAGVAEPVMREVANAFDRNYPGAKVFTQRVEDEGQRRYRTEGQGYINTATGRRLPCDEGKIYTLVNYAIQGGAAEVFKLDLLKLDAAGLTEFFVVPVHDEIVMSVPKRDVEEMKKVVKECMTTREGWAVPLTAGCDGPAERWGDLID